MKSVSNPAVSHQTASHQYPGKYLDWRINLLLAFALTVCALSLIRAQYQARQLFIELGRAQNISKQLELQAAQLQLEQSLLAKHARIEALVKRHLNMTAPSVERTQFLTPGSS